MPVSPTPEKSGPILSVLFGALLFVGCGAGYGEGEVSSEKLIVEGCADGPFDLRPNFFAAQSSGDTVQLRIQRGRLFSEASDGLVVIIDDVGMIRGDDGGAGLLNTELSVGLPVGVTPPGVPVTYNPSPPPVTMALYLNDSCDDENVSVYSVGGTIRFRSLWNGKATETSDEDRLIDADFDVELADPRELTSTGKPANVSRLTGSFRFYFERGQPAQAFP
jgi:hypothetical protein